jgi:GNAT superfamily N-acetyltransferase
MNVEKDGFLISDDKLLLDLDVVHRFIAEESYWGKGRSREEMAEAIRKSAHCFGIYCKFPDRIEQVGFARVVGDDIFFAVIADVFVLPAYRGNGLAKWLVRTILNHPAVKGLRRRVLFTNTPDVYRSSGFDIYDQSGVSKFMEHKN